MLQYANRGQYDTVKSKYVTLDQLAEMIRKGNRVEVFKAKTEEDDTAFILTQIVMEKAKNRNALLPVPLLHLIAFLKLCPFGASIKKIRGSKKIRGQGVRSLKLTNWI